jgi:hypothetical protein
MAFFPPTAVLVVAFDIPEVATEEPPVPEPIVLELDPPTAAAEVIAVPEATAEEAIAVPEATPEEATTVEPAAVPEPVVLLLSVYCTFWHVEPHF